MPNDDAAKLDEILTELKSIQSKLNDQKPSKPDYRWIAHEINFHFSVILGKELE